MSVQANDICTSQEQKATRRCLCTVYQAVGPAQAGRLDASGLPVGSIKASKFFADQQLVAVYGNVAALLESGGPIVIAAFFNPPRQCQTWKRRWRQRRKETSFLKAERLMSEAFFHRISHNLTSCLSAGL
jgi:hypothetical protein